MPVNIKNQKEKARSALMRSLSIPKTTRAIVINTIKNVTITEFLEDGAEDIGVTFIAYDSVYLPGVDAIITDDWKCLDTFHIDKNIIVPIGPEKGAKEVGLIEFNPMKFEGNAFLFSSESPYAIFSALVRYLENIKYPGDKRVLFQNISGKKYE